MNEVNKAIDPVVRVCWACHAEFTGETVSGKCPYCDKTAPDPPMTFTCDLYDVTCARCGRVGLCTEFVVEEGDEWECPPCWERCQEEERAEWEKEHSYELQDMNTPKAGRDL